jgi:hypothetical protein
VVGEVGKNEVIRSLWIANQENFNHFTGPLSYAVSVEDTRTEFKEGQLSSIRCPSCNDHIS